MHEILATSVAKRLAVTVAYLAPEREIYLLLKSIEPSYYSDIHS